jgi:hypothetical protein
VEVGAHARAAPCCNRWVKSSPRIDRRLIRALAALDDPGEPVAETHRRLGAVADAFDLPRPNYESVRLLVLAQRRTASDVRRGALLDLAFYTRSPAAAIQDLVTGDLDG